MDSTPSGLDRQSQRRPDSDLPGSIIDGRYRIEEMIGSGGMSTVYRAKHLQLDRDVALKMLRPDATAGSRLLERFIQEARAESSLKHPNVLNAHALGINEEHQLYLVTDYLHGQSLSAVLRKGPLPQDTARKIFLQICDGLAHAHAKGVIHRDLKPSNVMILNGIDDPLVKIVDFGIAKLTNSEKSAQQQLTQSGMILGSPAYMSPEQCLGMPLDARADIYSFGCLMFETLTGRLPFTGDTEYGVLQQHITANPPAFGDIDPETTVSPDIEAIVRKCLSKECESRYTSCSELKDALQKANLNRPYKPPQPIAPSPAAGSKQSPSKLKLVAICVGVLLFASAIMWRDALYQLVEKSLVIPILEQRAKDNQTRFGSDARETGESEIDLADAYRSINQPGKAALAYAAALPSLALTSEFTKRRVVEILLGAYGANELGICIGAINVGKALDLQNDSKDAEAALSFAGYRMRRAPLEARVAVLNTLADMFVLHKQPQKALRATFDSLALARTIQGNGRAGAIGNLCMQLGEEYVLLHHLPDALLCYEQAVKVLPDNTPVLQRIKQRAKARLGELRQAAGQALQR
jgi:serine/threonine protein kinase